MKRNLFKCYEAFLTYADTQGKEVLEILKVLLKLLIKSR